MQHVHLMALQHIIVLVLKYLKNKNKTRKTPTSSTHPNKTSNQKCQNPNDVPYNNTPKTTCLAQLSGEPGEYKVLNTYN